MAKSKSATTWKKGRGKLGPFDSLIGTWKASADSPMGALECIRAFQPILGGKFIQLTAHWEHPKFKYNEIAIIGPDRDGKVRFWSFTSDGKCSEGTLANVTDVHPEAVGFEAQMPAGLARMVYWPDEDSGFVWAVESKSKKGWKRFTEHHYHRLPL
jgi:WD40 repeat protein